MKVPSSSQRLILQHKSLEELPSAASNWKLFAYSRQVSIIGSLRKERTVTIYSKWIYEHILQFAVSSHFSPYKTKLGKKETMK